MIYIKLFWEFFKIGIFAVGGGMATLPFLKDLGEKTGWFTQKLITDMIAVSESTPGPIGINMATYVGCNVAGVLGGIIATLGIVVPACIIVIAVSHYLEKFRNNSIVDSAFYGLRPAVTGLIAAAGIGIAQEVLVNFDLFVETKSLAGVFDLKNLLLFAVLFVMIKKIKIHPIAFIALSAAVGIIFGF